jgi:hypothetical protein
MALLVDRPHEEINSAGFGGVDGGNRWLHNNNDHDSAVDDN